MRLDRRSRVIADPEVLFTEVDGDLVLLDGQSGIYYSLNHVGARLWDLIGHGAALGAIHEALLAEYDVPPDVLWADLARLVADLADHALVKIEAAGSGGAG